MSTWTHDHMSPNATINRPFLLGTNIVTCTIRECVPALWAQALVDRTKGQRRLDPDPGIRGSPKFMGSLFLNHHSIQSEVSNWLGPIHTREWGGPFPTCPVAPEPKHSPSTLSQQRPSLRHCVSPEESGASGLGPAGASHLQLASTLPAEGETKVP